MSILVAPIVNLLTLTKWAKLLSCPECGYEWIPGKDSIEDGLLVKDSIGNLLKNGDTAVVIKDLPVKEFSKNIKIGTKVKNIRLAEGDHNIDGFGVISLKSAFVKKA